VKRERLVNYPNQLIGGDSRHKREVGALHLMIGSVREGGSQKCPRQKSINMKKVAVVTSTIDRRSFGTGQKESHVGATH